MHRYLPDHYISDTPVTRAQWQECVRDNACSAPDSDADHVVVTGPQAQDYVGWLRRTTGKPYRLSAFYPNPSTFRVEMPAPVASSPRLLMPPL